MATHEQSPFFLKLKGMGVEFHVVSMVLAGEVARLPTLQVMLKPEQDNGVAPEVDAGPYTLCAEQNGIESTPFGVTSWFVQSVAVSLRPSHRPAFFVRLGALPGQHLPISGLAADGQPLSTVVQQVCDRYLGWCTVDSQFEGRDPLLGTVLSFGETLEQFLRRMALAVDSWVWFGDDGSGTSNLSWQPTLRGTAPAPGLDWAAVRVADEWCAAPTAVRTFWPRSSVTQVAPAQSAADMRTLELINPLPLPADTYEQTTASAGVWQTGYYLSDNLVHAAAWPGLRVEAEEVIVAVIHVYDQAAGGDAGRLLEQLVPGMRHAKLTPTLAANAAYGMLALSAKAGRGYSEALTALEHGRIACRAEVIGVALGLPAQDATGAPLNQPPHLVLATVCPWDPVVSPTWAAGGTDGTSRHTTEIRVRFDWSDVPVRVPYAYPMSGAEGMVFYPPCAGDRVLVLLDRLWPIAAVNAYQGGDALLPGVLRRASDIDTLSGQRGIVAKGGMVFRTAANGDLVIHAAGNLVLRAEKDIFLDGRHLREHGRAADGRDDALRQDS